MTELTSSAHTYFCIFLWKLASTSDYLRLQLKGNKLANKDGLFGKSDPFFTFYRVRENGAFVKVYQSETIMDNLNPLWKRAEISVRQICNGKVLERES